MRAIFGVLSLLIVLAIVGSLVRQQRSTLGVGVGGVSAHAGEGASQATVQQQSQAIQDKIRDDTARALQQGAERTERAAASN